MCGVCVGGRGPASGIWRTHRLGVNSLFRSVSHAGRGIPTIMFAEVSSSTNTGY